MSVTTRLTADERRTDVIAAASKEFAVRGYAGTSTQAIAERAGVSQPYLFQLFGTKKGLFIAATHAWFAEGMLLNVAASIGDLDDAIDLKMDLGGVLARP